MASKRKGEPPPRFRTGEAVKTSAWNAALATAGSSLAIVATMEPVTGGIAAGLTFVGTMTAGIGGEYISFLSFAPCSATSVLSASRMMRMSARRSINVRG